MADLGFEGMANAIYNPLYQRTVDLRNFFLMFAALAFGEKKK